MTQRPISLLILIAALLAAIAFYVAPWFAFRAIREAAGQGDSRALAELIDYAAVREGLAPDLAEGAPEPAPPADVWHDPLGALRQVFKPRPTAAPATVNRYLTASAIASLSNGRPPGAPTRLPEPRPFPVIRFWDPNRCRISVAQKHSPPAQFTFERRGLYSWRLVRIVPPGEGPAADFKR